MSWWTELRAMLAPGRSVAPAAPSVTAAAPPASSVTGGLLPAPAIPVLAVGEALPPPMATLLRAAGFGQPDIWAAVLAEPMRRHAIRGRRPVAAFLANIAHETGGGARLIESLDYTPERLAAVFGARATPAARALCRQAGRPAQQLELAELLYGGEWGRRNLGNTDPGDGWRFRGRGLIQVTGRGNYTRLAGDLGMDLGALLVLMESRDGAAETACRWWAWAGCNALAEAGDLVALRKRVNGGTVGLADVAARYQLVMQAL